MPPKMITKIFKIKIIY